MPDHNAAPNFASASAAQTAALSRKIDGLNRLAWETGQSNSELDGYHENHAGYINAVAAEITASAANNQATITAVDGSIPQMFTVARGEKNIPFDTKSHLEGQPFSAEALGLPPVPAAAGQAIGIAIEKTPAGFAERVSAVVRTKHGDLRQLHLENVNAAADPNNRSGSAWVSPGKALLSKDIIVKGEQSVNAQTGKGVQGVIMWPGGEGNTVTFVRRQPTKTERKLDRPVKSYKKRLIAGAALAGLAVGSLFGHSEPENSMPVNSGIEMIAQPNTDPNGIEQASSLSDGLTGANFTPQTLRDARQAFNSYFAGDKAGLKRQAEALGYHNEWISPDKLAAVEHAQNMDEVEQAANEALADSPVRFTIVNNQGRLHMLDGDRNEEISSVATDLDNTKATVEDALAVINTFSIKNLKDQVGALNMVFVGNIQTVGSEKEVGGADGYTLPGPDATRIVIATDNLKNIGDTERQGDIGHELIHRQDERSGTVLSERISELNPDNYNYQNPDGSYTVMNNDAPVFDQGNQVVSDSYGATNSAEDTATAGQNLDVPNPTIDINRSPFQQKEVELLLSEEQQQPGFIASMLSRAKSVGMPGFGNQLQKLWNNAEWPVRTIGIASLVLGAVLLRKKQVARRTHNTYYGAGPQ